MPGASYVFPDHFIWGAAAASAQIEGAAREDGKGESIWDRFAATPGRVKNGDTPEGACEHYHRYADDAALLRQLGIGHYRLSVAWPRVFPAGTGAINPGGLDFYFVWSLLDNFEWAEGYAKRFGIVRVDYSNQRRIPKLSARWYSEVIRANRVV